MSLSTLIYNRNNGEMESGASPPQNDYGEILAAVQTYISKEHAQALADALTEDDAQAKVLGLIQKYIIDEKLSLPGTSAEDLARRLHTDMCGFSVLDRYLHDPVVEEINVNRYDDIEIRYPDRVEKVPSKFASPQQAQDIARRLVHCSGKVLDSATPRVDAYTEAGVRIHAKIPPIIAPSDGAALSIRKQRCEVLTLQDMIKSGVATMEMLIFLKMCLTYGVSVGIVGETGCGKTTDVTALLNALPYNVRILTIEDTREIVINPAPDEDGIDQRSFVQESTRMSDDPRLNITLADLVRDALRQNPNLVAVAEMRGEEASDAKVCAESGQTIITTFHARSAKQAYSRLLSMCQMSGRERLPPYTIMQQLVELFPIMVHKVTLGDGTRRIYEIVEATSTYDATANVNTLFRFNLKSGRFERVGAISEAISQRLRLKGADEKTVAYYEKLPPRPNTPPSKEVKRKEAEK